jgi:hypothetical protein
MQEYMDANWFFQGAGDIVPLNVWVSEDTIAEVEALHNDTSAQAMSRVSNDHAGTKSGIDLKEVPTQWGIPESAGTCGSLKYMKGEMLYPHRDKWGMVRADGSFKESVVGNGVRLINFLNHTPSTEFNFIYDGKIFSPEPRRWYAINTQRVHYGYSFVDNVYHIGCELRFDQDRKATSEFLLKNMAYGQPFDDRKGVDCKRN